jgi:hypothetical protein
MEDNRDYWSQSSWCEDDKEFFVDDNDNDHSTSTTLPLGFFSSNSALSVDFTGQVCIIDIQKREMAQRDFLKFSSATAPRLSGITPAGTTATTITTTSLEGHTTSITTMDLDLPPKLDEVQDVLRVMTQQYQDIYCTEVEHDDELTALWRRLLIDWMYFVVDYCKCQRESVAAAAYFLDVVIARKLIHTKQEFQLAAATSLQLAIKAYDCQSIELTKLVQFGRQLFTEDDVIAMETTILRTLNWRLHPPSTYCYLRQYERLLPSTVTFVARRMIADVTKLVSELTVTEPKYNSFSPAITAYAGILMAMELIDHTDLPVQQRHCFVLHMQKAAELESKSPLVLKAFDELKQSFDTCPKLQDVIDSIASTKSRNSRVGIPDYYDRFKKNHCVAKSSPRQVISEI